MFKVILIEEHAASYRAALTDLDEGPLPDGDVIVRVSHSTLNYKYALAIMTRQGGPRLTSKPCAWRSAVHPAHS